jgi:hypothetical protein
MERRPDHHPFPNLSEQLAQDLTPQLVIFDRRAVVATHEYARAPTELLELRIAGKIGFAGQHPFELGTCVGCLIHGRIPFCFFDCTLAGTADS